MRVHCFQHVAFEGMGSIAGWLTAHGAELNCTRLDEAANLPDPADVDWLIVLGGPMSANEEGLTSRRAGPVAARGRKECDVAR